MRFGNIDSPDIIDTTCEVVYDSGELAATTTSITISNLDGDSVGEYRIIARFISGNGSTGFNFQINGDTGTNYGSQEIDGQNATASAQRATSQTSVSLGNAGATGYSAFSDTVLYAKSGKVRTWLNKRANSINGTTVDQVVSQGNCWNNTVDNITSFTIFAGVANGIGIGSRIIILRKNRLTTGTKTGEIDPVGTTYGHWQLIYDNTLTAAKTNVMLSSQMDSYTKLLIHADGADAATTFYDFSNSAHAITAVGTAQVDTAQSKFGGASLLLDGNSDYISVAGNSDFAFGTGDFTVDFWVRWNVLPSAGNEWALVDLGYGSGGDYDRPKIEIYNSSGTYYIDTYLGNGNYLNPRNSVSVSTGVWYHVAVVRSSGVLSSYFDGVQLGSETNTANIIGTPGVQIGQFFTGSGYHDGWIDEVRVSKGIARWTANFTPPTRAYNELDGDRDCVYRLIKRIVTNITSGGSDYGFKINQSTNNVFGYQQLFGYGTTVLSQRVSSVPAWLTYIKTTFNTATANERCYVDNLIYAKSGFSRVVLSQCLDSYSATNGVYGTSILGNTWNNQTDKITSFTVYSDSGGSGPVTNALDTGTHIELWRLNL